MALREEHPSTPVASVPLMGSAPDEQSKIAAWACSWTIPNISSLLEQPGDAVLESPIFGEGDSGGLSWSLELHKRVIETHEEVIALLLRLRSCPQPAVIARMKSTLLDMHLGFIATVDFGGPEVFSAGGCRWFTLVVSKNDLRKCLAQQRSDGITLVCHVELESDSPVDSIGQIPESPESPPPYDPPAVSGSAS